ncbi:MAG TPA: hypothetical protein VFG52_01135 [Xanthomonadales bacterium]|nr:hypothetical protein [Xanthomonadales bacterium]
MVISTLLVLKWVHILAMVYWLGGEWGVFQTSYFVVNRKLSMEERRRHMHTAYKIDILARTGILLLFPLGFHMGHFWGVQPFGGVWLWVNWIVFGVWLAICWAAFIYRETDRGIKLTLIDERIRFVFIPLILVAAVSSLLGYGPFEAGQMQKWYSAKVLIFGLLLMIGLKMRFIMREWTMLFRVLDKQPGNTEAEATLERSIRFGRGLAYVYWVGIASVGFLGAVKPF